MTLATAAPRPPRIPALDMARGAALLAMFVYHLAWDAHYFGLSASDPSTGGWKILSHAIASGFLFLAGVSLALAHRQNKPPAAMLRRLAVVAAAAVAVSLATYSVAPQVSVTFGILHCIALASLLALPLLGASVWLLAVLAVLAVAAPQFAASSAFDGPWLDWTGLNAAVPRTLDYRPLLPWAGALLAGVVAGRLGGSWLAGLRAHAIGAPLRLLAFGGRHSLAIYLVHQPVFLALLFGLSMAVINAEQREAAPFLAACGQSCTDAGSPAAACKAACACVADRLKASGQWSAALRDTLDAAGTASLRQTGQDCRAAAP